MCEGESVHQNITLTRSPVHLRNTKTPSPEFKTFTLQRVCTGKGLYVVWYG